MRQDIDLAGFVDSYDWEEVFGEGSGGGNCTNDIESPDGTSCSPVTRSDVAEIIAAVDGENDAEDWAGVFRLKDGRYLVATGGCDYTGWDCQAENTLTVARDEATAVRFGMSDENRERLGYPRMDKQNPEATTS